MTPIAAMIRFLTVGSCPFNAASSFKSRTGFESFDDIVGKDPELEVALFSIEADAENEQPLATTISVVVFDMLANVGMFKPEMLELLPTNGVEGLFSTG